MFFDLCMTMMFLKSENVVDELRTQNVTHSISLQSMLHDAWQYRQNKATTYQSTGQKITSIPWTATSGTHGVRVQLSRQVSMLH